MRIADRIKTMALERGYTERQVKSSLADICGIKYQAVQQWFSTTNPSPENLAAIARFFGANLMWIITGEGAKYEMHLSEAELEIIESWRSFPEESQRMIIAQQKAFLASLADQDQDDPPLVSSN